MAVIGELPDRVELPLELRILKRTSHIDRSLTYRHHPIPYTKPAWGTLAGVNLQRGALQFEVPLGTMLDR